MSCRGGGILLVITGEQVSRVVVAAGQSSPAPLRGKGHVDLFLGQFSFRAGQMPDLERRGTWRLLTVSNRKTDVW